MNSMKNNHTSDPLGYAQPKDFSKKSKQKLLTMIDSHSSKKGRAVQWIPIVSITSIAASLLLIIGWQKNIADTTQPQPLVEDTQITNLLMESLLLEEEELDTRLQEALLNDFENAYVDNENF